MNDQLNMLSKRGSLAEPLQSPRKVLFIQEKLSLNEKSGAKPMSIFVKGRSNMLDGISSQKASLSLLKLSYLQNAPPSFRLSKKKSQHLMNLQSSEETRLPLVRQKDFRLNHYYSPDQKEPNLDEHNLGSQFSPRNNQQLKKPSDKGLRQNFVFHHIIGVGGFGRVWKIQHTKTSQIFALKQMHKALVIAKNSVSSVINERKILGELNHPFLVNMLYAFQDKEHLNLVMDYKPGGDLRYHICKPNNLNEQQTQFIIACIILGLEYLHTKNIIHRDIKPENLVMDQHGYVHITDFGIAKYHKQDLKDDTSGTPGYMAPEVILRQPHSFQVDYYALGVIAFEIMVGRRPYVGRDIYDIREQMIKHQAVLKKSESLLNWSDESLDFANQLIQRRVTQRLGFYSIKQLKQHPWFYGFNWDLLAAKKMDATYLPNAENNFDLRQIFQEDQINLNIINEQKELLLENGINEMFLGYEFRGRNTNFLNHKSGNTFEHNLQPIVSPRNNRASLN